MYRELNACLHDAIKRTGLSMADGSSDSIATALAAERPALSHHLQVQVQHVQRLAQAVGHGVKVGMVRVSSSRRIVLHCMRPFNGPTVPVVCHVP